MKPWKVIVDKKCLCVTNEYILAFKKGYLYLLSNDDSYHVIKKNRIGSFKNHFSLLTRLFRLEPRCAIRVDNSHFLISFNGNIYNYCISNNSIIKEHAFKSGMKNPLCFCSFRDATNDNKRVLYGEYFWNLEKGPVAIYERYNSLWKKVYEFKSGQITHIHNIIYDSFRDNLIILTGDTDDESGIWIATKDFSEVKPILLGKQQFRSCVAFPMRDGILFLTDTPLESNFAYFLDFKSVGAPNIKKILQIPGPCIFGGRVGERCFFSTSVEPDSSLNQIKYRITRKPGKGNIDSYSYLFEAKQDASICEIERFKKDSLPLWMFQFGNLLFPENETDKLMVCTQSVKPKHGVTIEIIGGCHAEKDI